MSDYRVVESGTGILVVFDPARRFEVPAIDPEGLEAWFAARALVLWREEPDRFEIACRVGPVPDGVGRAPLRVESGQVAIGDAAGLRDGTGALQAVAPGRYQVGVTADGPGAFTVHLEAVESFEGLVSNGELAPYWWDPGALSWSPPDRAVSAVPLLSQLELRPASLATLLLAVGRAIRAVGDRPVDPPLRVCEHSLERVGDDPVLPRDASLVVTSPQHGWSTARCRSPMAFPGRPAGATVRHVWVLFGRPLLVQVSRDGDRIRDVGILTRDPQSDNDRDECRALVQQGYDAGRPLPLGMPQGPLAIAEEWSGERLLLRVGPVPRDRAPALRVHLHAASGEVREVVRPPPVRYRDGCWEYEVWLVGPRRGLCEAHVEVVADRC